MEEIVTILSTREWAIAIWGTGFFVWKSVKVYGTLLKSS